MNNIAEERKAYVVEEEGKTRIFIGNMQIEIVEEDEHAGPLGWKDGQDPGVIFWEHDFIKKSKGIFEHSGGRLAAFTNLDSYEIEKMRDLL